MSTPPTGGGSLRPPGFRCADAARARGDQLAGTALPVSRFLLVEVPGHWPRDPARRLPGPGRGAVQAAAAAADARLLLVRRPARRPDPRFRDSFAWAVADVRPGVTAVQWGTWTTSADLAAVDPAMPVDRASAAASGPQLVALVCAQGSRDVCCALRGRPIAAALVEAAGTAAARPDDALRDLDVWESTHVGGCRFAPSVLVLPTGDMFGALDPGDVVGALRALTSGRIDLAHHRGRCGRPAPVQAVAHLAAEALGDDRYGAVGVRSLAPLDPTDDAGYRAEVEHDGTRYRARLLVAQAPPALLTCTTAGATRATVYRLAELTPAAG